MFGYIGENSTPDGGHTNRAEVNKLGDLFGGKGDWLPKRNPGTNTRLEKSRGAVFSGMLTAWGDFEGELPLDIRLSKNPINGPSNTSQAPRVRHCRKCKRPSNAERTQPIDKESLR